MSGTSLYSVNYVLWFCIANYHLVSVTQAQGDLSHVSHTRLLYYCITTCIEVAIFTWFIDSKYSIDNRDDETVDC